jgi:hypothetical protein
MQSVKTGVPESTFRYMFAFPRLRDWLMKHYARSDALPLEPCIVYFPMLAGLWITPSGFVFVALRKDLCGTPLAFFEVPPDLAQRFLDAAKLAISIPQVAPSRSIDWTAQSTADAFGTADLNSAEPRCSDQQRVVARDDGAKSDCRVTKSEPAGKIGIEDGMVDLLTLYQAACLVNRKVSTLRHYRKRGLPEPFVEGKKGQPHEYLWSEIHPWLEKTFCRKIPDIEILKFRRAPR